MFKDMTEEQVLELIATLKELMRVHDWYYDYSDDFSVWSIGQSERRKIAQLISALPQEKRNDLICLSPPEVREQFMNQVEGELRAIFESAAEA